MSPTYTAFQGVISSQPMLHSSDPIEDGKQRGHGNSGSRHRRHMQGPCRGKEGVPARAALHEAAAVGPADDAWGGARPGLPGEPRPSAEAVCVRPSNVWWPSAAAVTVLRPELHQRVRQPAGHRCTLLRQLDQHLGCRAVPQVRRGHLAEHGVGKKRSEGSSGGGGGGWWCR